MTNIKNRELLSFSWVLLISDVASRLSGTSDARCVGQGGTWTLMTESPEWAEGINENGDARPGRRCLATRRDAPRILARCANICCGKKVERSSPQRSAR